MKADSKRRTGNKLAIVDATSTDAMKPIQAGESADLASLLPAIRDLSKQGKLDPASVADIASPGVGIGVKMGAPKPDISTVAAFHVDRHGFGEVAIAAGSPSSCAPLPAMSHKRSLPCELCSR